MLPLLPESFWEFHDSFVPSETAGPLGFFDKCDEPDIFIEVGHQDHELDVIS